jgi:hypothetical protein
MNFDIIVKALACAAATTLVSNAGSAHAQANNSAAAETALKPNIGRPKLHPRS